MINGVYLALGTNLGDRKKNLAAAVEYITKLKGTNLAGVSSIYETEPVGYAHQDKFLNMVVKIRTELEPVELLLCLQEIELALKRTRNIRWGPRTIDIDILLYGDEKIDLPDLKVPHPRMFERAFVLVPLRDVYTGDCNHVDNLDSLIMKCEDRDGVKLFC